MSAARKLTNWEAPRTLGISLQKSRVANDNAIEALEDARENSRLGIFVFAHTSLPASEPANDGIAAAKSEAQRRNAAEPGITGKEEDVEVGLQYFGKRYLNPLLGRWISADPLAVHAPGSADANLYAYVSGMILKAVDPIGLQATQAEQENGSGNYFNNQWRQSQGPNASAGDSAAPAPNTGDGGSYNGGKESGSYNGDNEFNNGIGENNGIPFAAGDPIDGSLGGQAGASGSTPEGELGFWGNVAAGAGAIMGEGTLLSDAPNASSGGIPGGMGAKENGGAGSQALYAAGVAASEGMFGRLWGGVKKLWGKLEKIGDLFKGKPTKTIVIGEDMKRVEQYAADNPGVETYPGPPRGTTREEGMEHNRQWLRDQMDQGAAIDDIGPAFERRRDRAADGKRPESPYYQMERTETKNYPARRKRFERRGRTDGGLPGE